MTWGWAISIITWALGAHLAYYMYPIALEQQGIYDRNNLVHRVSMGMCIALWPVVEVYTLATYKSEQGE